MSRTDVRTRSIRVTRSLILMAIALVTLSSRNWGAEAVPSPSPGHEDGKPQQAAALGAQKLTPPSPHERNAALQPDPAMQQVLDGVGRHGTAAQLLTAIAALIAYVEDERKDMEGDEFARQALYYFANAPHRSRFHAMRELIQQPLLRTIGVTEGSFIRAAIPHLETEDQRMRAAAQLMMAYAGAYKPTYRYLADPIFDELGPNLGGLDGVAELPSRVYEEMFDEHPYAAARQLLLVESSHVVYQEDARNLEEPNKVVTPQNRFRPAARAKLDEVGRLRDHLYEHSEYVRRLRNYYKPEELEAEAREHLAAMTGDKRWYVRLYVAQMMKRHPEVRDANVIQRMRDDSSALVRKCAAEAQRLMEAGIN